MLLLMVFYLLIQSKLEFTTNGKHRHFTNKLNKSATNLPLKRFRKKKEIMQEEIWKDIPGYEGIYQVSDLGRVRSLERVVVKSDGRMQPVRACIIKTSANKQGYSLCGLWKDKKRTNYHVHQLTAMAFLDHIPCGHTVVVDHINNIKTDNRLDNIQLVSPRYNVTKDLRKGTSKFVGVYWHIRAKKWAARIIINGKSNSLGYFHDESEAALAYQKTLKEHNDRTGFN